MNPTQQQKKELRKQIKQQKAQQLEEDKILQSNFIFAEIEQLDVFKNSTSIMIYWSMDDEVKTHAFIEKWWWRKNILLPVVDGNSLKIRKYEGTNSMVFGEQFGILEPKGIEYQPNDIELLIIPGIAFDKNRNRMGRGRGFYDRLLQNTKALKIGVCFDFQMVNDLPTETHDLKMDDVITFA